MQSKCITCLSNGDIGCRYEVCPSKARTLMRTLKYRRYITLYEDEG